MARWGDGSEQPLPPDHHRVPVDDTPNAEPLRKRMLALPAALAVAGWRLRRQLGGGGDAVHCDTVSFSLSLEFRSGG